MLSVGECVRAAAVGPAAATSAAWLLTASADYQLHNVMDLGFWSLRGPDSPQNQTADLYTLDVDDKPPTEVLVYRGQKLKAYRTTASATLVPAPVTLTPETRAAVVKGKTLWELSSN